MLNILLIEVCGRLDTNRPCVARNKSLVEKNEHSYGSVFFFEVLFCRVPKSAKETTKSSITAAGYSALLLPYFEGV